MPLERIAEYAQKCRILRQIQSNRAKTFRRINTAQNVATVVVSSFLTFIGFSGIEKIHEYLNWLVTIDKQVVEFAFNMLVFFLFLLVILHLVFQFGKKQAESERAIVLLTNMINNIGDRLARAEKGTGQVQAEDEEVVRQRYEMIIEVIPSNSDREFLRARNDFLEKETKQSPLQISPAELFDESRQKAVVESLIRKSEEVKNILEVLREVDSKLFVGGGILRNLVWDFLHGFMTPTPIDDVDVIYFDGLSKDKEHDRKFEQELKQRIPNLRWSVKNQARMHIFNGEEAYVSLEDAISKWPETATAFIVRLTQEGRVKMIAPFGFSDLFRLVVVPTPHFENRTERIRHRVDEKEWEATWPKLKIMGVPPLRGEDHHKNDAETVSIASQVKPEVK